MEACESIILISNYIFRHSTTRKLFFCTYNLQHIVYVGFMSSSSLKTNWTSHYAFMPLNYSGTSDNSEDSGVEAAFFLPFWDPILAGFSSACFLDLWDCKLIMIVVGKRGCSRVARRVIETQWISRGSWRIDKTPMQSVAVHRTPKALDVWYSPLYSHFPFSPPNPDDLWTPQSLPWWFVAFQQKVYYLQFSSARLNCCWSPLSLQLLSVLPSKVFCVSSLLIHFDRIVHWPRPSISPVNILSCDHDQRNSQTLPPWWPSFSSLRPICHLCWFLAWSRSHPASFAVLRPVPSYVHRLQ